MNSAELANQILDICVEARRRVLVEGEESYSEGNKQRFEAETLEDELTNLEEELLDTINWAAMAVLKLRERRANRLVIFRYNPEAQIEGDPA